MFFGGKIKSDKRHQKKMQTKGRHHLGTNHPPTIFKKAKRKLKKKIRQRKKKTERERRTQTIEKTEKKKKARSIRRGEELGS